MNDTTLLEVKELYKNFQSGTRKVEVLRGVSLSCLQGELLAVMGPSGCGKTTLLNLISGLDRVDQGEIRYRGKDLVENDHLTWDSFRRRELGMVFQFNQLLPEFSALENTFMPSLIAGETNLTTLRDRAHALLDRLGLKRRSDHRPAQLSGGEQQRVAIARALMNHPGLILADEPTGSLDHESGLRVFDLLRNLQKDMGFSCLLVTHNRELAARCDRIFSLYNTTSTELD